MNIPNSNILNMLFVVISVRIIVVYSMNLVDPIQVIEYKNALHCTNALLVTVEADVRHEGHADKFISHNFKVSVIKQLIDTLEL